MKQSLLDIANADNKYFVNDEFLKDIDFIEEYQLIKDKKSKLSKSMRDYIVYTVNNTKDISTLIKPKRILLAK